MADVVNMENNNNNNSFTDVTGVRRRVYCLGIICMLLASAQIAIYMIMFTFSISEDYSDYQVAFGSGWMVLLTSIYLGFSGRVLFLLYERRYEEAKGPEWLWWYSSMAVVLFNITLVIWFGLLSDIIPAVVCGIAACIYIIFFVFASKDIKHIGDHDSKAKKKKTKGNVEKDEDPEAFNLNINIDGPQA